MIKDIRRAETIKGFNLIVPNKRVTTERSNNEKNCNEKENFKR